MSALNLVWSNLDGPDYAWIVYDIDGVTVAVQITGNRTTLWMICGSTEPERMPSWRTWGWQPSDSDPSILARDLRASGRIEAQRLREGGEPVSGRGYRPEEPAPGLDSPGTSLG